MDLREILMGKLRASNNREILSTTGIGSCLAIMLYDATTRMGAMAHAMLPGKAPNVHPERSGGYLGEDSDLPAKHIEGAIDGMLWKLEGMGANRSRIEAKLAGAANMFPDVGAGIGEANIASAKRKLAQEGILLVGESLGGHVGRSVEFATGTGIVTVKIKL